MPCSIASRPFDGVEKGLTLEETKAIQGANEVMSARQDITHVHEVQRVSEGGQSHRDPAILSSWRHCVAKHGFDPVEKKQAHIVPEGILKTRQQAMEAFLHIARYGLEDLYRRVSGHGYVLLLTDHQGVTVDYIGDVNLKEELCSAGLYLGSEWSESRAGTCGVGSCIETGEALTAHQTDHFDAMHGQLTCTAAPIYDHCGELAAVLDISALHSPEAKES